MIIGHTNINGKIQWCKLHNYLSSNHKASFYLGIYFIEDDRPKDIRSSTAVRGKIIPPESWGRSGPKMKMLVHLPLFLQQNKKQNLIILCILVLNSWWIVFIEGWIVLQQIELIPHSTIHLGVGPCINYSTFHPKNPRAGQNIGLLAMLLVCFMTKDLYIAISSPIYEVAIVWPPYYDTQLYDNLDYTT